jgi:hypothetical protein
LVVEIRAFVVYFVEDEKKDGKNNDQKDDIPNTEISLHRLVVDGDGSQRIIEISYQNKPIE